ncbi:MAG: type III glutamate--ammonia ligase, partial [Parvibaculum sp.]
ATWAPNTVTYGGNNRTHMVRIPDAGRFEIRLGDGAANPYLMPAAYIAAGLDGMERTLAPGKRLDINMYTDGHKVRGARTLPLNLLDALRELDRSKALRAGLGAPFVDSYLKLKRAEWDDYMRHLSDWERETTLDC